MKKFVFTFIFLFLASAGVSAQEKYSLKICYPEGTYLLTQKTNMDMTIHTETEKTSMDMPMKQKQTQMIKITAGPVEADGTRKVTMEFIRVIVEAKMAGPTMELAGTAADMKMTDVTMKYDSADDSEENAASPLSQIGMIVGMKLTMTYDGDGKITRVEGLDEFFDQIAKKAGLAGKALVKTMKKSMKSESFTKTLDMGREMQPPAPVAVGDSWQTETDSEIPMVGKTHVQMDNTLVSVETVDGVEIATIHSVGTLTAVGGETIKMGQMETEISGMKIEMDSLHRMEVKTGLVVSNTAQVKQSMTAEGSGSAFAAEAVKTKTSVENTAEVHQTVTRE